MNDAMIAALIERRMQLRALGYLPIPLHGKIPPMKAWQQLTVISPDMIRLWSESWRDATNTGAMTRFMPALDLDLLDHYAAEEIERLVVSRFGEDGNVLVRIGQAPKRAILFRTEAPFKKITVNLIPPSGDLSRPEKIEVLCDGQQAVVDGVHPDTHAPYRWFGGVPWDTPRIDLPQLVKEDAHQLVDNIVEVLVLEFGYRRSTPKPITPDGVGTGEDGWRCHLDNIRHGHGLHDTIRDLAAMLAKTGMHPGAATHLLQALVELSETSHDERWEARYRDIPRAIDSAYAKYSQR